jgi:hypothetical protein
MTWLAWTGHRLQIESQHLSADNWTTFPCVVPEKAADEATDNVPDGGAIVVDPKDAMPASSSS